MTATALDLNPNTIVAPEIDPTMPWANWDNPTIYDAHIHEVEVRRTNGDLSLMRGDERLGKVNTHCLRELSTRVGFPVDFVEKLDLDLRELVINDRIQAARPQDFCFAVENDQVSNIMPGWRGINAHPTVAQLAYNVTQDLLGGVAIKTASVGSGEMVLRFGTDFKRPVTRRKGDVLSAGIEVRHSYGMDLGCSLFVERLVCTNGMTGFKNDFDWSRRTMGDAQSQLGFLTEGITRAAGQFEELVAKGQEMAEAKFSGDYATAIHERARLLHIPRRFWGDIVTAFNEEPGDTEWALLNAFTRFATHRADYALSRRLQADAGNWLTGFDIVTARLPRLIATRIGGQIMEIDADLN